MKLLADESTNDKLKSLVNRPMGPPSNPELTGSLPQTPYDGLAPTIAPVYDRNPRGFGVDNTWKLGKNDNKSEPGTAVLLFPLT
jgi:hypothetical protein